MRSNTRSTCCLYPAERKLPGFARILILAALALMALLVLAGCDQLPALAPRAAVPVATSVAETVQAALQPAGIPLGTAIAQTVAAAMPSAVPPTAAPSTTVPELPTTAPTYTPYPTYTPLPTFTEQPTYTPLPTYTPFPPPVPQEPIYNPPIYYNNPPTPFPQYKDHPFVLRVWNRNPHQVMWIGTEMPYGGNFIKPNFYVEFYPPYATWMHIVYCRRDVEIEWPGWWNNHWYNNWDEDWFDNYKKDYVCSAKDVFVDKPFQELSVK